MKDAPWIEEAELFGTEKPDNEPREAVAKGLASARDKVQEALAIIRQLPESCWDDQITEFDNAAERLEIKIDALACALR